MGEVPLLRLHFLYTDQQHICWYISLSDKTILVQLQDIVLVYHNNLSRGSVAGVYCLLPKPCF